MPCVRGSSSKVPVCVWVILLLHCTVICNSVTFEVVGPAHRLHAVLGEDLVLPCSLKPSVSAEGMTVEWFRLNHQQEQSLVHLHKDSRTQNDKQIPSYANRTSLFKDELKRGNTSLKLSSVQVSDEGDYKCFIESESQYDDVLVQVLVRGFGQTPLVSVTRNKRDGIALACQSGGWMPKPALDWLDSEGRGLAAEPAEVHMDSTGFKVKQQLIIHDDDSKHYVCRVSQKDDRWLTEKKVMKEAVIHISNELFHPLKVTCLTERITSVCPAIAAAVILGFVLCVCGLNLKLRNYKKKCHEYKGELSYYENDITNSYNATVRKICIFQHGGHLFGLDRVQSNKYNRMPLNILKVNVRLDANTSHPLLMLSDDAKEVRCTQTAQDLPDNTERFDEYPCVLGKKPLRYNTYRRLQFYYEVKVTGKTEWTLGLMKEPVRRKGAISDSLEQHFIIGLKDGHYWASTTPKVELELCKAPKTLRVLVDFEWHRVSFYDAGTKSLIYSFRDLKFKESLYPMFVPGTFSEENMNPLIINPN